MKWILARLSCNYIIESHILTYVSTVEGNCRQQVDSLAISCSTERSSSTTKNGNRCKFQHLLTINVLFLQYLKTTLPLNLHNFNYTIVKET